MTKAMTDRLRDRINLVLVDWRVRVFELYVLIDRPSDCLYVLTITIFGYMDRRSGYRFHHHKLCHQIREEAFSYNYINIPLKYLPSRMGR